MGLEAATYINQLDSANPLAGDRKNQGDDHLRLLKATLKTTLPNAGRPFRFPATLTVSAGGSLSVVYENITLHTDTAAGPITFILPDGATLFDGWRIRIVKASYDANPVFVQPASGNIFTAVGPVAQVRLGVPYEEHWFYWNGSWSRHNGQSGIRPGSLEISTASVGAGYALANGASLLRTEYPELFTVWGTTFGAVDGAHFNMPNLLDRFPVFAGSGYALGATGGETTHVLTTTEMPAHSHSITQNPHDHAISASAVVAASGARAIAGVGAGPDPQYGSFSGPNIDITPANADITINNTGGNGAHENRPPYFGLYPIFRMC